MWHSNDTFHREWALYRGEQLGKSYRLFCTEQCVPVTEYMQDTYLIVSLKKVFDEIGVDDKKAFAVLFVSGYLIGFGVLESAVSQEEAPF